MRSRISGLSQNLGPKPSEGHGLARSRLSAKADIADAPARCNKRGAHARSQDDLAALGPYRIDASQQEEA